MTRAAILVKNNFDNDIVEFVLVYDTGLQNPAYYTV